MKANTSLYWIFFSLILISSCGSTKHTQAPVPIPEPTTSTKAPANMTETDKYINSYKYLAIKEMQRAKIPASITLAQAILESSVGQSFIARNANNHFGIKCNSKWTGPSINYDDDIANECFRQYGSVEESFIDHSNHLTNNPRYSSLFSLSLTDYQSWAKGLKAAGYATRSNYAELLIGIIDRYQLYEFDKFQSNKPKGSEKSGQFVYNGLPAVMVREGDTYDDIIKQNKITEQKLIKYNDLEPNQPLHQDMILYLKSKKSKGKETYHIVKDGETMYGISQDYGIKLDNLCTMNLMTASELPAIGELIYLKQKRFDPPSLRKELNESDKVKKDEPQESVFSDNQKKNIDQNNDFVMPKKETPTTDDNTAQTQSEPVKAKEEPVETNNNVQPSTSNSNVQPVPSSNTYDQPVRTSNNSVQPAVTSNSDKSLKSDDFFNSTSSTNSKPTTVTKTSATSTPSQTSTTTKPSAYFKPTMVSLNSNNPNTSTTRPATATTSTTNSTAAKVHLVQKGESMFSISKLYGLTVLELQTINGMNDNAIKIGQKLRVNKDDVSINNLVQQKTAPVISKSNTSTSTNPKVAPVVPNKTSTAMNNNPIKYSSTPIDTSNKRKDTLYHVVAQGETFYSISRLYKIKISDIIGWNNLKEYKLSIDQKLVVGAPDPKPSSASSSVGFSPEGNLIVPLPKYNDKGVVSPTSKNIQTDDKYHIVQPKQTLFLISKMYNTSIDNLKAWNSLPDNSISIGQKLRVKP